jgi:phosphoserine phosphatase RsbX
MPFQVDVGHRVRAMPGEHVAGDVCFVSMRPSGPVLALIDGLGHGEAAAAAAERCRESFAKHADLGLGDMLAMAHRDLRGTRGAVATLARIRVSERALEVAGVGNASAVLFQEQAGSATRQSPVITPGVLGSAFRSTTVQRLAFDVGALLVLHSDGLRSRFDALSLRLVTAQSAAEELVGSYGKTSDDAGCIVARALSAEQQLFSKMPSSDHGNERRVSLRSRADAQVAANEARKFAAELGFGTRVQWEIGIAAAELASNAVKYGQEGVLALRRAREPHLALVVEVSDRGAGMGNAPSSEGTGLGVGLESVKRLMDDVEVRSIDGLGTRVTARRLLGSGPRSLP